MSVSEAVSLKSKAGKIQSEDVSGIMSKNHHPKSPLASGIIKRTFAGTQPMERGQGICGT